MTISKEISPITQLQENASQFFERFQSKYGAHMKCAAGCSKCCHTDISVFESEAAIVVEWYLSLDDLSKKNILGLWTNHEAETLSKAPEKAIKCAFLVEQKCSIYPSRPSICRTQGASLLYKVTEDKNSTVIKIDVCPLNFNQENSLPDKNESLDLDRLNTFMSIAENFYQKEKVRNALEPLKNKQQRISLTRLKKYLRSLP